MGEHSMLSTPIINTVKIATCNSLSGLTQLQYCLGYEAGHKDQFYIRIAASNGNGKFNSIFWSLAEIEDCLAGIPVDQPFQASALKPVFAGRSVNTMYFVLAALLDCRFLRRADRVEDGFVRNAQLIWHPELQQLANAGTNLLPESMTPAVTPVATPPTKIAKSPKKSAKTASPGSIVAANAANV
jgi:hypothetical protein